MALRIGGAWLCTAVSVLAVGEIYTPPPFGYYQPILDRMPFGALPSNFNTVPADSAVLKNEAQVKAEQQILAKKINMSAVNVTPDGQTAIGFTDLEAKPPANYYLLVGSAAGGWTVVNADYDEETATIEKAGVTITLKLGTGLVDPASLPAKPGSGRSLIPMVPPSGKDVAALGVPPPQSRSIPSVPTPLLRGGRQRVPQAVLPTAAADTRSYAERLRDRAAQQTQAQLATEVKQREQLEKIAHEAAAKEIKRREEETAQTVQTEDPPEPAQ
jgi:hypothetical protein